MIRSSIAGRIFDAVHSVCTRLVSDILVPVKLSKFLFIPALLGLACVGVVQQASGPVPATGQQQNNRPASASPAVQSGSENPPVPPPQQVPAPPPAHIGPVVILDPEHGGADDGARGSNGLMEKDVVLRFAQTLGGELKVQGYRVVMTRTDDSDPSYDDRDATANLYRDMIFISLHVSSTGTPGTVHTYYYSFWTPVPTSSTPTAGSAPQAVAPGIPLLPAPTVPAGWIPWQQAQRGYTDMSHAFADTLQGELSKQFSGSPGKSTGAEVRELRSVTGPAVAVEVSSVAVSDPAILDNMTLPLAAAIVRGIQGYRPRTPQGGS